MPKFSNEEYARATIANADREELQEAQEEVEQLESQLTEARAEIEKQGDFHADQYQKLCRYTADVKEENRTLRARIAALEADVVFCARRSVEYHDDKPTGTLSYWDNDRRVRSEFIDCDGTPADILRAVREARNGVS